MKNKYLVYMMAFLGLGLADLFYLNSQIIPTLWPGKLSMAKDASAQKLKSAGYENTTDPSEDRIVPQYILREFPWTRDNQVNLDKVDLAATTEKQVPTDNNSDYQTFSERKTGGQVFTERNTKNQLNFNGKNDQVNYNNKADQHTDEINKASTAPNEIPDAYRQFSEENKTQQSSLLTQIVVRFESSEFRLKSEYIYKIRSKLAELDLDSSIRVIIDGYTDQTGAGRVDNYLLSQQRADYVAGILMRQGILKERITARGHGDSNPVDKNHTKKAWAKNRRVEINIFKDKS
ncbi:MAG: OmpA family protein [Desulfobacteraceae bacterium]